MNESESGVIEINFLELLGILLNRWWIILLCVLVFGGAAYGYTNYMVTKMYVSTGKMYINTYMGEAGAPSETQRSTSVITASQKSVLTCIEVLKSTSVISEVAKQSGLGYTSGQIKSMLSMSAANDTEVLEVKVTCENPEHAKKIVDTLMTVATTELKDIVGIPTIKIIEEGTLSRSPVSPNVTMQTMIGAFIGGLLAAAVIVIIALQDKRIKSEEDLKGFEIPVIGVIPDIL